MIFVDKAPVRGGRKSEWVRKSRYWKWFAGYYPVRSVPHPPERARSRELMHERVAA